MPPKILIDSDENRLNGLQRPVTPSPEVQSNDIPKTHIAGHSCVVFCVDHDRSTIVIIPEAGWHALGRACVRSMIDFAVRDVHRHAHCTEGTLWEGVSHRYRLLCSFPPPGLGGVINSARVIIDLCLCIGAGCLGQHDMWKGFLGC